MNEKEEILKHLIACHMFAPSMSALAKRVGYKGKAGFYRLMKGEAGEHTVNEIWKKIKECYCLTDKKLGEIYKISHAGKWLCEMCGSLEEEEKVKLLYLMLDNRHEELPDVFSYDVVISLQDLKEKEPDIYYGHLVSAFLKWQGFKPYSTKDFMKELKAFLASLDKVMVAHYPENQWARTSAQKLVEQCIPFYSEEDECLWRMVDYGIVLMRYYADPDYKENVIKQMFKLFGWGEVSYWTEPDAVYGEGSELWVIREVPVTSPLNGICIVLRLVAGKVCGEFSVTGSYLFGFYDTDGEGEDVQPAVNIRNLQTDEMTYALYQYDEESRILYIVYAPEEEDPLTHNLFVLPETYRLLNRERPEGKQEKVWCRMMEKFEKSQCYDLINRAIEAYGGFEICEEMEVKNVSIDRTHLSILIEEPSGTYNYQIGVEAYPFLKTLTPFHDLQIVRRKAGNSLSAEWFGMGMSIPLAEFEKVKCGD